MRLANHFSPEQIVEIRRLLEQKVEQAGESSRAARPRS
jgi:hypothetical protein